MRFTLLTIFSLLIFGASVAQDTLTNHFKDNPTQVQSWYIVNQYKGQALNNGSFMEYYQNGELKISGGYSMGQLHGNYKSYSDAGQLLLKCRYTNGILNGEHKTFYDSGNLKERRVYINGKLQGDYKYFKDEKDAEPYLIEKYKFGTKQ